MLKSIELLKLESQIQTRVFKDNGRTVHFEYDHVNKMVTVRTMDPHNGETFLMKHTYGTSLENALGKVIKYLSSFGDEEIQFTVLWNKKGEGGSAQTSYFFCTDMLDVCNKFFHDRVKDEYVIYSIEMTPIA